jgi:ribosomal protein S18 acetylase RimI-like enzyme
MKKKKQKKHFLFSKSAFREGIRFLKRRRYRRETKKKKMAKKDPSLITFCSLDKIEFEELFAAFSDAFSDYDVKIGKDDLRRMLERRGYDGHLSFGAFNDDKLVAFTFNCIGMFRGIKSAYDTGTGTVKDYRGLGLAGDVISYSLPFLKDAGVQHYLLDVLQHNTKAVSVYKKVGFEVAREFDFFKEQSANLSLNKPLTPPYYLVPVSLTKVQDLSHMWDFYPAWQNSTESMFRMESSFLIVGAFLGYGEGDEGKIVGYGIIDPETGDIPQLAVDKDHRRQGIASAILRKLIATNTKDFVKMVNTESTCESIKGFNSSIGLTFGTTQFEMIKVL